MSKFRKKPVVIDAVQFTHPMDNDGELLAHLEGCIGWHVTSQGIVIPTLEGDHLASVGDWIIRGIKGEYYPCKADIFAATYEPVDEPSHLDFTDWRCETCGHSGRIQYVKGASVYEVLHILEDAHREASKGACVSLEKMRVTPVDESQ